MALDSFNDILDAIQRRADELTDGTSALETDATDAIHEAWRELLAIRAWLELRKYPPGVIQTVPSIENLTVTATAGTTSMTLSATSSTDLDNYILIPSGADYFIRITAHTAGSAALTVDSVPADLSASACVIAKIEYDLPTNCGVLVDGIWHPGATQFIPVITEALFREQYPEVPSSSWPPAAAARVTKTKIRFSSYPTARKRMEIPYAEEVADPSGSTELAIGRLLRNVLLESSLAILYERKDDSRQAKAEARAQRYLSRAKDYDLDLQTGISGTSRQMIRNPYSS